MSFQRIIQIICLGIFLTLLTFALTGSFIGLQQDFFLRLDPTIGIISSIAGWKFLAAFFPAIIVVALCLLFGRIFCGHICPMGTTLDGGDFIYNPS